MIFGDAGSGSVPDTIVGGGGEFELADDERLFSALPMPKGNMKNAINNMKARFFSPEFNISLSPFQRE